MTTPAISTCGAVVRPTTDAVEAECRRCLAAHPHNGIGCGRCPRPEPERHGLEAWQLEDAIGGRR